MGLHNLDKKLVLSSMLIGLISTFYCNVYAQGDDYLQYENSLLKIKMKYPKNWVYTENTYIFSKDDWFAKFIPSSLISVDQNTTLHATYVTVAQQRDLPYKNMPLDVYLQYVKKFRIDHGDNITNTGLTLLSDGTPAYEIDFINKDNSRKAVIIIMNKNPQSYYFMYDATVDKFDTYLPVAKQMFRTVGFR